MGVYDNLISDSKSQFLYSYIYAKRSDTIIFKGIERAYITKCAPNTDDIYDEITCIPAKLLANITKSNMFENVEFIPCDYVVIGKQQIDFGELLDSTKINSINKISTCFALYDTERNVVKYISDDTNNLVICRNIYVADVCDDVDGEQIVKSVVFEKMVVRALFGGVYTDVATLTNDQRSKFKADELIVTFEYCGD